MAIKLRLLRAEKRLPAPPKLEWPGIQAIQAEWDRLRAWLAEKGLTAEEAHRRRLKVPGNRIVQPAAEIMRKKQHEQWQAKQEAERAAFAAKREPAMAAGRMSSVTQQGEAACTSNRETPPT